MWNKAQLPQTLQTIANYAGAGLALILLFFFMLSDVPLLDWDTYERMRFIDNYSLGYADVHLLYHWALRTLVRWGLTPLSGVFFLTALSVSALFLSAWWVLTQRGLSLVSRIVCMLVLLAASPGVAVLTLTAEDNVAYLPPLLLFYHFMTTPIDAPKREVRRALFAGAMLAMAMMINITALIFLALGPLAIACLIVGQRKMATRLGLTLVATLAVYYSVHLVAFTQSPVALHQYFAQAMRVEDFEPTKAPLLSLFRIEQYTGGARAMFLAPTAYRFNISSTVRWWINGPIPLAMFLAILTVAIWAFIPYRSAIKSPSKWPIAGLGLVFVTMLFPYLYEPPLIERWDMLWLWFFLGFAYILKSRPKAGIEVLIAHVVFLQAAGFYMVVSHHYGRAYENFNDFKMRKIEQTLQVSQQNPVVLPLYYNRHHLAYFVHRLKDRRFVLIGNEQENKILCRTIEHPLYEKTIPCDELTAMLRTSTDPFFEETIEPSILDQIRPGPQAPVTSSPTLRTETDEE